MSEANESLKETAGNLGAEAADKTFGQVQRAQQQRLPGTTQFYEKPTHIGREAAVMGYEATRDYGVGKVLSIGVGAIRPLRGGKFKMYWNKQEIQAAEFVWRTEGRLWRREAEVWLMKEGKLIKTSRRLDALLIDVETGQIQAAEWTTAKSLSESAKKKAQLEYQRELFAKAKEGWTVLARPAGEESFYDITKAAERTEVYSHWRKP